MIGTVDDIHAVADELEAYFRSGNDVPVERATIPRELADRILEALRFFSVTGHSILSDVSDIGQMIEDGAPGDSQANR